MTITDVAFDARCLDDAAAAHAPERRLVAAVLCQAIIDISNPDVAVAIPAFAWIANSDPQFRRYAELLGFDPRRFARRVREAFADELARRRAARPRLGRPPRKEGNHDASTYA